LTSKIQNFLRGRRNNPTSGPHHFHLGYCFLIWASSLKISVAQLAIMYKKLIWNPDPCLVSQPNCKGLLGGTRGTSEQILGYAPQALVSFKKYMPPSSSLLQGKHLPFPTSPQYFSLICDPFADPIISLNTPKIFLFSTATFTQTNWTRIFSIRRMVYFPVIEMDTATSGPV
jgi:hypothetical protein